MTDARPPTEGGSCSSASTFLALPSDRMTDARPPTGGDSCSTDHTTLVTRLLARDDATPPPEFGSSSRHLSKAELIARSEKAFADYFEVEAYWEDQKRRRTTDDDDLQ
jgi:hypothetical protein